MRKNFYVLLLAKGGFGLLFVLTLLTTSCRNDNGNNSPSVFSFGKKECEMEVPPLPEPIKITRLEEEIIKFKTPEDAEHFLKTHPAIASQFLMEEKYPAGLVKKNLFMLSQDTAIRSMYNQVKSEYRDLSVLEQQFSEAFAHIRHYYPDFKIPRIYSIITGLGIETFVSDSMIVLSLDFFLGPGAKYKPMDPNGQVFPDYILRRYQKPFIVPACMLYISNKYNKVDMLDNTLLSEMIYYGKAYEFVKTMMPCTPDSLIIGYTSEQIKNTKSHESVIWAHFIERKLLYETSHFIKTKYTGERPYTAEIGPKCPGKIGTWLGWRIVKEYQKAHPDSSFQSLMKNKDSRKIFMESKFKPVDIKD